MSRPSLAARPTRNVAGVVAEMLGTEAGDAVVSTPLTVKTPKTENTKTARLSAVNTATKRLREKTSFAMRPDVKRHLTMLKLDLREAGHRVSEAEIVETLIAQADAKALAATFQTENRPKSRRRTG